MTLEGGQRVIVKVPETLVLVSSRVRIQRCQTGARCQNTSSTQFAGALGKRNLDGVRPYRSGSFLDDAFLPEIGKVSILLTHPRVASQSGYVIARENTPPPVVWMGHFFRLLPDTLE